MTLRKIVVATLFICSISSCNKYDQQEFISIAQSGYFNFNFLYEHPYDSTVIEFFSDSLYVFRFRAKNKNYAQLGKWKIDNSGYFSSILILDEYGIPFELSILELDEKSEFKSEKGKISMTKAKVNELDTDKLIGTWVDPLDSFPSNMNEYANGIKFMHPTFTFTDSTYLIRADDILVNTSTYKTLSSSHVIILEENKHYTLNPLVIIKSLTNEKLTLQIKGITNWQTFELIRVNKTMPNKL